MSQSGRGFLPMLVIALHDTDLIMALATLIVPLEELAGMVLCARDCALRHGS